MPFGDALYEHIMNNENETINHIGINLIYEYFLGVERQGIGSPEATVKALSFIDNLTIRSHIADIGCGTGGQTMTLAQNTSGQITGIDIFPDFIHLFNRNAEKRGVSGRVKGFVGSMDNLPFQEGSLDLIWSEGAIYNIGFEKGFREWRKFLKPGGFIAVSECCWLTDARPQDYSYLTDNFLEIDSISNKLRVINDAGYVPTAHFVLPEECWTENYYAPMTVRMQEFMEENNYSAASKRLVDFMKKDIAYYLENKAYYGYVFFIAQKTNNLKM